MNYDIYEKVDELSSKVEFLFDIVNQLEVNNLIPSKIIERSRNRIRLEDLKREQEKNPSDNNLKEEIKRCMDKELILHEEIQAIIEKKN